MSIKTKLHQLINLHWYNSINLWLTIVLWPLMLIYSLIIKFRKALFDYKILPQEKLAVPVVVIGNITVGGSGKTPSCKYLAAQLEKRGLKVGIILRGYGGSATTPQIVKDNDDSQLVGDEALIYTRAGLKVAIGRDRVAAGKILLNTYPDIQIILSDDGLQHYRLFRDFEICVLDGSRMLGNKFLLPMGPLREVVSRLNSVNALVINGAINPKHDLEFLNDVKAPIYNHQTLISGFLNAPQNLMVDAKYFIDKPTIAMAAIGNPERFFNDLSGLGIKLQHKISFPDHYHYQARDISAKYAIITTEKDYTKLTKFNPTNLWVAQLTSVFEDDGLVRQLQKLIN